MNSLSASPVERPNYNATASISEPVTAVRGAYAISAKGRKQASLAASRLESLLFRDPGAKTALSVAAMEYLAGADLTKASGCIQAAGQAIVRRLNEALDGHSARITRVVLEPENIAALRIFRQQVRVLIKPETAQAE